MTTTKETLSTLMSLVDNNSDQLKEGEYLSICNLLRDMHKISTNSQPQPQSVTPAVTQNQPSNLQVIHTLNQIWRLRNTTPRICLRHKLTVLRTLDIDLVNALPQNGLTQTQWVQALENAYHTKHPNQPINLFPIAYREFRNEVNAREIDNLRLKVGQLRVNILAERTARETELVNNWPVGTVQVTGERINSLYHPMVPP